MEKITNAHCDGMARRLAAALSHHAERPINVTWGQPYGHVYHVEQDGTQLALAETSVTKRGCYDAMHSACVALEALTVLKQQAVLGEPLDEMRRRLPTTPPKEHA